MTKFFCIVFLIIGTSGLTCAQVQIGLKFSPTISTNRIDGGNMTKDGSGLRVVLGPVFDFVINQNENYLFSTGLWYANKRAAVILEEDNFRQAESHNVQYIIIPATIKLKTQEIALDKRIYIQFGPTFEIAVHNKLKSGDEDQRIIEDFGIGDVGLLMGAGLEWHLGNSTRISTGLTYTRGLIDTLGETGNNLSDFSLKNDLVSLDFTVIF